MLDNLDNSYSLSVPLLLNNYEKIKIVLVGCGGTGSACSLHIARIAFLLRDRGKKVSLTFVDPDKVESKNIPRQNFSLAEIGLPKAQTLALRLSAAWGIEIEARSEEFHPTMTQTYWDELVVVVGAVDSASSRRSIATALTEPRKVWWIDAGNSYESGQVLIGNTNSPETLKKYAFPQGENICSALPSPTMQHPELLEPEPKRTASGCAQIAEISAQSLMVNQRIAAELGDYLLRLLVTKNLRRFATYFDLPTGSARSKYICKKELDGF